MLPEGSVVVADISGDVAVIHAEGESIERKVTTLGFAGNGDCFRRSIAHENDRVELIEALAIMGALFSKGHDWSPAELIDYYRELGLVKGKYRTIAWKDPSEYVIEDH